MPRDEELPVEIQRVLSTVQDHREDGEKVAAFYNALKANIKAEEQVCIDLTTSWIYHMFGTEREEEEDV